MAWLDCPPLRGPLVQLVLDEASYQAALAEAGGWQLHPPWNPDEGMASAHTFERHDSFYALVSLYPHKALPGIVLASLLVHEAVHVWQAYCEHICEDNPSREFEAYGIQRIAQDLMTEFEAKAL